MGLPIAINMCRLVSGIVDASLCFCRCVANVTMNPPTVTAQSCHYFCRCVANVTMNPPTVTAQSCHFVRRPDQCFAKDLVFFCWKTEEQVIDHARLLPAVFVGLAS
jgi:hypothetical protein